MSDIRAVSPASTAQSLNQAQGGQAVRALRGAQADTKDPSKIDKAARDFESILVGQWLEQAEKSFASVPGTNPDQDNDSGHDQFQSIACQSLAQGMSKTGKFGIAEMLNRQLRIDASRERPTGETGQNPSGPKITEDNRLHTKGL